MKVLIVLTVIVIYGYGCGNQPISTCKDCTEEKLICMPKEHGWSGDFSVCRNIITKQHYIMTLLEDPNKEHTINLDYLESEESFKPQVSPESD